MSDVVVIYHAENEPMAHALVILLKEHSIDAIVQGHGMQLAWGTTHWASPRVVVSAELEVKARQVVEKFEQQLREQRRNPRVVADEDQDDDVASDDEQTVDAHIWPTCPACKEPRPAQCPFCKHSGHDFGAAYGNEGAERTVVCPQCDEPFTPVFFRLCHKCGHDYGDGKEVAATAKGSETDPDSNWRVYLVLAVVVAAIAGIFLYFSAATSTFVPPPP